MFVTYDAETVDKAEKAVLTHYRKGFVVCQDHAVPKLKKWHVCSVSF